MEQFIKYGGVQSIPLYNCSAHTPAEWTKRDGVPRPILGLAEAISGFVIDLICVPMLTVMLEISYFKLSCYKIMSLLAIVDIFSIIIGCMLTGWLAYHGAVFCSYPELIFLCGVSAKSLWCCSCIIALILVSNRLCDLLFPRVSKFLFDGNRTFFILFLAILYALYFAFFNTPVLFTSKLHSWFFDPMIFEGRGSDYENIPIVYNNFLVVFVTCFLYIVFCFVVGSKLKNVKTSSDSFKASIQILFQSALICAVNLLASMIYVSMNYIEVPVWLIITGNFSWQLGNCAPVIIYSMFNTTIRNGVLRKFGMK